METRKSDKIVKIGCFSGFWGDSVYGAQQLVRQNETIDYLVGDYLAEVTMGILARQKKQPTGGYIAEFVKEVWVPLQKEIVEKNIKVITNAGAMNPLGLKKAIEEEAKKANLNVTVAAVYGDDLTESFQTLLKDGDIKPFQILGEEDDLPKKNIMMSCNVYTGAFPVAKALSLGAQVIVTGRAVDSAIVLGPLIHEFGWKTTDYDRLAAGSVAGHIIECGCQATGGNFTDWEKSYSFGWDNVGYPIASIKADGTFTISKPLHTGGLVTCATVSEQMVYEIHDPANYYLPDVIVDFRGVKMEQLVMPNSKTGEGGKVLVTGARGRPPTPFYKASLTYIGGFQLSGGLLIGGIDAKKKAEAVADGILGRVRRIFKENKLSDFDSVNVEVLGAEHIYGPHSRASDAREVFLRITVTHPAKQGLAIMSKEIAPSALAMAPGITGAGAGRPRFTPSLLFRSCLVNKTAVQLFVQVGDQQTRFVDEIIAQSAPEVSIPSPPILEITGNKTLVQVPLVRLCYGRSGDKGDTGNIGIICREPLFFHTIEQQLTEQVVQSYFGHLIKNGQVKRYIIPGIFAFNFVITRILGGGGLQSLNMDRQGKCLAQQLLDIKVTVPAAFLNMTKL